MNIEQKFTKALDVILHNEGGWSDHPEDPGGATNKGITLKTYSGYLGRQATKSELRNILNHDVETIYRTRYWNPIRGDELPYPLALMTFDAAVNSGVSRGARWLQQALEIPSDGHIGPITIKTANDCDIVSTVHAFHDIRMHYLRDLSHWPTFGKGWERRCLHTLSEALSV